MPTSPNFRVNKKNGFTLVELLVVIAIMAILSLIAFSTFSSAQKNARDAKRKGDIDAIAKALESNKPPEKATYNALSPDNFSGGSFPTNPQHSTHPNSKYCVIYSTTPPTQWGTFNSCPQSYLEVSATDPRSGTAVWEVCALLESGTVNSGPINVYCRSSTQ